MRCTRRISTSRGNDHADRDPTNIALIVHVTDDGTPPWPTCTRERYPVNIEDEMSTSFLDYSMWVIISRAHPRRPRRSEAGPSPHPLRDEPDGHPLQQAL